jgi:hypothetical protein
MEAVGPEWEALLRSLPRPGTDGHRQATPEESAAAPVSAD